MVEVRSAVPADVPAIQRIARASWHATYGGFVPESTIEEMLAEWYSDEVVRRGVTTDEVVYLVAERSTEDTLGYASAGPADDGDGTAVLASIYVLPERWGEGVGTALHETAVERLRKRGFEFLRATVLADNEVGVSFYHRQGFEQVGRQEEELGGETYDALVVKRSL